jgi:hypothetical protein
VSLGGERRDEKIARRSTSQGTRGDPWTKLLLAGGIKGWNRQKHNVTTSWPRAIYDLNATSLQDFVVTPGGDAVPSEEFLSALLVDEALAIPRGTDGVH